MTVQPALDAATIEKVAGSDIGPVPETPAWRATVSWLAAGTPSARNASSLARFVGVSQPAARAWIKRRARPEGVQREVLCTLIGGSPEDWDTDAERREREDRLREAHKEAAALNAAIDSAPASGPRDTTDEHTGAG